jgi:hypothetical protein
MKVGMSEKPASFSQKMPHHKNHCLKSRFQLQKNKSHKKFRMDQAKLSIKKKLQTNLRNPIKKITHVVTEKSRILPHFL